MRLSVLAQISFRDSVHGGKINAIVAIFIAIGLSNSHHEYVFYPIEMKLQW